MVDISADEISSSVYKCDKAFLIDQFRETEQEAIVSLLEGEDILFSQPMTSEKLIATIAYETRVYSLGAKVMIHYGPSKTLKHTTTDKNGREGSNKPDL